MSLSLESVEAEITKLLTAETSIECLEISSELGTMLSENGLSTIFDTVLQKLLAAARNKKSGLEREGGLIGIAGIAKSMGSCAVSHFFPYIPTILDLEADKGLPVREAARLALHNIINNVSEHGVTTLLPFLIQGTTGKWLTKLATLELVDDLASKYPFIIATQLPEIIPPVTNCMHDTKLEVNQKAIKTMTKLCSVVGNPDIEPHIGLLVDCMAHPDHVTQTVQKISATTFVAEVTGPALALMVPLLVRALNDRSASVMRPTTVIADNLFKLVRNPVDAGQFLDQILPSLDKIIDTAAFPEIRDLASQARMTLVKAAGGENDTGAVATAVLITKDDIRKFINVFLKKQKVFLTKFFEPSLDYSAALCAHLCLKENFKENDWLEVVAPVLKPLGPSELTEKLLTDLLAHFHQIYRDAQVYGDIDDDDEGELLCDCEFSLAYGGMMLLNNTRLRLRRGQRYGLCGTNGAGILVLI
jgi:elongation factor 3